MPTITLAREARMRNHLQGEQHRTTGEGTNHQGGDYEIVFSEAHPHARGFLAPSVEQRPGYLGACPECGGGGGVPVTVCCRRGETYCGDEGCNGPEQELEPCERCETTGRPLPLCGRCQERTSRDGSGSCGPCQREAMGALPFVIAPDDDLPF